MELQRRIGGFYFQGEEDSTTRQLQATMASAWDEYVGQKNLSLIRQRDLTWERIFSAIADHAGRHPDRTVVVMFDEIHWIARRNAGFVSKVKRAWLSWEKTSNIKVIICGSSNRFFDKKTGTASSILRGLRTHSDIWVRPFSLDEVRCHFFPLWSHEEICLIYMMVGGIPYYLNQIPCTRNVIKAINTAFFTRSTIFFDEVDEIINIEFNKSSKMRVRQILAALGQEGKATSAISRSTGIPESSVRESIDKLVDYGLVFEKTPMGASPKKNRAGSRYYMRDFFLNFYFQVLKGQESRVRENRRANLFANVLSSKAGYYIPGFSGLAFELLIESVVDCRAGSSMDERMFDKLGISEKGFDWGHYWEPGRTQVDLVVESSQDRESRVIEAKWIAGKADVTRGYLEQTFGKGYTPPRGYRLSFYLVMSKPPTKGLREVAEGFPVQFVGIEDLF